MKILSIVTNRKRLKSTFLKSVICVFIPIATSAQTNSQLEIFIETVIKKSGNFMIFAKSAVAMKPKINNGTIKVRCPLELYKTDMAKTTMGSARTRTILKKVAKIPVSSFIEYPAPTT